jgi:hypothetical protein
MRVQQNLGGEKVGFRAMDLVVLLILIQLQPVSRDLKSGSDQVVNDMRERSEI